MSGERVIVTGGAGYIGSHACHALAAAGYLPVTIDNLVAGHEWAVKWGPLEIANIRDSDAVATVIRKHSPIAVMHFAAYTAVAEAVENPSKYYWNNVGGTLSLLEALRETGLNRIVFSSTAAVYGTPTKKLISETDDLSPINPYGRSKLMSEMMIRDAARAYGIGAIVLRYFNAAGAAPEAGIGQAVPEPSQLIPRVLDAALGRNSGLAIFGDDYATKDGTCIRDFVHVKDLATAHVAAVSRIQPGRVQTYNLGVGQGASVREVIETCSRVTGRAIPFTIEARRSGDAAEVVADPSLAKEGLGWTAAFTDLARTISDAWAWQSSPQFSQLRHGRKDSSRK
jgi:UDP-arabinose 4-epimerase